MSEAGPTSSTRTLLSGGLRLGTGASATLGSIAFGIVIWETLVLLSGGWVPSTYEIALAAVDRLTILETYSTILISLGRIAVAFFFSFVIGVALGMAMGLWSPVDAFWRPLIAMALAIPDPVYFIMAILVLGPGESVSLFALTLAVLPFAVSAVAASMRARDPKLDDMAEVYRLKSRRYTQDVLIPQVAPAIVVAARTAFAFSWKIGVLMEAMTRSNGVGAEIYFAFRLFRADEMMALALIFILVMRGIEIFVFGPLERRAAAWRG